MASIQKRENGRWRARYRDAAGREHARHFPRKVDAQQWLDQVTAAVVTGSYVDPRAGRVTFSQFYRDWAGRQIWAPGTQRAMDLAAATTFADLPMRVIQRSHVEAWVKAMSSPSMARQALQPSTVRTRFVNVRSIFRAAVADRVIPADPTDRITLPRRRRAEQAMSIPTPGEVGRILRAAPERFAPLVALCAFGGLRLGEAAALRVGDIDFLRQRLLVQRQVQRLPGGQVDVRLPKYGSERTVMLADQVLELLASYVAECRPGDDPERWLFVASQLGPESPPHQNTVGHWWRQTLKAAGLSGIRLHDLRHYFASGLIAAGCDVVTVQRALGHASAATTLRVYAHLWPSAEDRTRAAASLIFAEAASADSPRTEGVATVSD